ncbi:MAG: hypothetical protein AAGF50_10965 [Pseudomonadota bacterium]
MTLKEADASCSSRRHCLGPPLHYGKFISISDIRFDHKYSKEENSQMENDNGFVFPSTGGVMSKLITLIAVCAVFFLALVSRVAMIDRPPIYDELYQFLPAVSWHAEGTFAVLDGIYDRAYRFTQLIALSMEGLGQQTLTAARFLPSVLPGAAFVAIMFLWGRLAVGLGAGLVTATLMIFWPNGIEVSQYLRFYALQGFLFGIGAILVFTALATSLSRMWAILCLVTALLALLAAFHLQKTTLLGVGAIGLWAVLVPGMRWLKDRQDKWLWIAGGLAVGLAVVAAMAILMPQTVALYLATYRWEPWPVERDTTFYHRNFRDNYPTLWPLFPVAVIVALRTHFMIASFCAILFATTFFLQSFGGLKGIRYLYPTMPFFFLIWGIVIQEGTVAVHRYLRASSFEIFPKDWSSSLRNFLAGGLVLAAAGWLIAANASFERSARLMVGAEQNTLLGKWRWTWHEASAFTQPWLEKEALLVTTEEMLAVAWLGDYDVGYNKPRFSELVGPTEPPAEPFTLDRRSGRPLIGERTDLMALMNCSSVGVILSNRPWANSGDARAIETDIRKAGAEAFITVGTDLAMLVWEWPQTWVAGKNCQTLAQYSGAANRILSTESMPQLPASAMLER